MFWAAIINDEFVGSFKVGNGPKKFWNLLCFLKKNFLPCWKRVAAKVKKTLLFIQDNASS